MASQATNLTEVPLDILVIIFRYLDASSFIALCNTCKAFQEPSIRLDPAYWRNEVRDTFRVPNQPVVQNDGLRWQKMYRRLLTQSRVYTWGNNTHNRLGHPTSYDHSTPQLHFIMRRMRKNYCAVPMEMEGTKDVGIIADLQCGGWSTTILTSKGALYTVGVLDGQALFGNVPGQDRLQPLGFPAGYPSFANTKEYEPTTALQHFSAGRSHILGLSDSGRIWSWKHVTQPALHVKFLDMDIKETSSELNSNLTNSRYGQIKKVAAGWSCSSAYIYGRGIVLWTPVERGPHDQQADTMLVLESYEVPKTSYQKTKDTARESDQNKLVGAEVGEVLNYIILENFVVFVTSLGKVFCARLEAKNKVMSILEIVGLRGEPESSIDVQGSFREFAIFKGDEVITTGQYFLSQCWSARNTNPEQIGIEGPRKIPALQQNGVISVAFGDYHYHALHSTGKITSYGKQLQSFGALGLGDIEVHRLRGITREHGVDSLLLPHAYTRGREVWFRRQQHEWLQFLSSGGKDPTEAERRLRSFGENRNVQGEVSEWIEQEGRYWDRVNGEDGLGAYFALGVSAAGWHSGALVLVNEELAATDPPYDWHNKSFPRLRLSDGQEMPGTVPFDEWREGRPEWNFSF